MTKELPEERRSHDGNLKGDILPVYGGDFTSKKLHRFFSPSHSSVRIPARGSKRGMQVLSATGATDVKELRSTHAEERANLRIRKVPQGAESQDEHRAVCHRKSRNGSSAR